MKNHPSTVHPDLLVGMSTADDAGVYSLGDGRALVQTIDVFAPVVDEPQVWGAIAAANALSDIYAMGGTPLTALQYLAWPRDSIDFDVASLVIEGGMSKMAEAGCTVVGGHSIDGPEPHYGFALTGLVDESEVFTNSGGCPGDVLVLTKPLGMGVVATAIKRGSCPEELRQSAVDVMTSLNAAAADAARAAGATAVTDVTGFGLLGHLRELADGSEVGAVVEFDSVPVLDGVEVLLDEGMWAGGSGRNLASIAPHVLSERPERDLKVLADAQTSGGLLIAVPPDGLAVFFDALSETEAWVVGRLTSDKTLMVV